MTSASRLKLIEQYRTLPIKGIFIDFRPLEQNYNPLVVSLRNQKRNRYYLNQEYELTQEMQEQWYQQYLQRNNDIYWCIFSKENVCIGTVRLYNIDPSGSVCEHGSFIIDEQFSNGPFAMEAEFLSHNFGFDILNIGKIINNNRSDNRNMNSISKRLGYTFIGNNKLNNVDYRLLELERDHYKRDELEKLLSLWKNR